MNFIKPNARGCIIKAVLKSYLLLIMLSALHSAKAQTPARDTSRFLHIIKPYILPCSSMFVSGLLDGTIETINYHYYNGFKLVFPKANDQFWNPAVSWTNKYKDHNAALGPKFPGSTTAFVFTTDAYHALRTARNFIDFGTITYYINRSCNQTRKPPFRKYLLDALIIAASHALGFTAAYSVIFR